MVNTKRTSKKSPGASASHMSLPEAHRSIKVSRKRASAVSSSKGKEKEKTPTPSNTESHSISNSIKLIVEPQVPTHVLTVEVRGAPIPKANMDEDHDEVPNYFFLHFTTMNS